MVFKGIKNQSVEIKLIDYEFPNIKNNRWDSNWLIIYLNVKSENGNWDAKDPALLTFEVKDLIDWLKDVCDDKNPKEWLFFTEPNLSFKIIKNTIDIKTIRVNFDLEFLPENAEDDKDYFVDCDLNKNELEIVIEELEKELKSFPERGKK